MLSLVLGASTHAVRADARDLHPRPRPRRLAVRRRVDASPQPARLLGWVQVAMGLAALATLPVYDFTFGLMEALMTRPGAATTPATLLFNLAGRRHRRAGDAAGDVLRRHDAAARSPARCCAAAPARPRSASVYAANTLGAIAGVVLAVHVGLPLLGLKGTLIAGCLVDAALGLVLLGVFGTRRDEPARAAPPAPRHSSPSLPAFALDANKMTAGRVPPRRPVEPRATRTILFTHATARPPPCTW